LNLTNCSEKEQKVLDKNGNGEKIRSRTANKSVKEKSKMLNPVANMIIEVKNPKTGKWVRLTVTCSEYVKMHVEDAKDAGYTEIRVREKRI
jgi:hypothetical protein